MDFFEAQARARKRTSRLVVLFGAAVIGTIVAGYLAAVLVLGQIKPRMSAVEASYRNYQRTAVWRDAMPASGWWDPGLFAAVSAVTLGIVGIASLVKWRQYSAGGEVIAESVGGHRVDPQTTDLHERRLLNVVEEMAIASGTPVPAVYILADEPAINAFAAGLTTSDAVVAVTRGTLEKLSRDELQGVIGHEFSHILNGDMRLNLRIAAIVFGILALGLAGRGILWSLRHTRVRTSRKGGGPIAAIALIGLALLVIGYIGYFFGRVIQAAVSRQREFLADAAAVQFTRNPAGLTGALKKIGGYALGSTMQSNKSGAIGHFFFAQAFRSGLIGLWSTHPPLPERIRAIDPQFDGRMFEPPAKVDVARESFATAGFSTPHHRAPDTRVTPPPIPASRPTRIPFQPSAAISTIGSLTPEQIANAQLLLESIPESLKAAAHQPSHAPALVYGLLLAEESGLRARQKQIVAEKAGIEAHRVVDSLDRELLLLRPESRLPLLQLTLPILRHLPQEKLSPFLDTLDELVHADAHVSPFEFALQKLLTHTLELSREPGRAIIQYYSFNAVVDEISTVLSVLARTAVSDGSSAAGAFACGAAQLKLVAGRLSYLDESAADLATLDSSLDKLARASLPIKQRTLIAAAHVISADNQIRIGEAELLRAIAASLDCPMPPLAPTT